MELIEYQWNQFQVNILVNLLLRLYFLISIVKNASFQFICLVSEKKSSNIRILMYDDETVELQLNLGLSRALWQYCQNDVNILNYIQRIWVEIRDHIQSINEI